VTSFLTENPSFVAKPDSYLPSLLDPSSALFAPAADFTAHLFKSCEGSLATFERAISRIRVDGYAVLSAAPLSSAYYRSLAKESTVGDSAQRLKIQELLELTEFFILNPNAAASRALAERLRGAARLLDPVGLLLGKLLAMDSRFVWAVVLAHRFLAGADDAFRARVRKRVARLEVAPKSRKVAMERIARGKWEQAFAFALAETDDGSVLARIEAESKE
jgi:hypothetical protein